MTRLAENLGSTNDVSEACMFHEAASPSRRWSSNSPRLRLRWKLSSVHRLTSSQAHARSIPASQVDERSVLITSWGEPFRCLACSTERLRQRIWPPQRAFRFGALLSRRSTPSSRDGVELIFAFPAGGAPSGASVYSDRREQHEHDAGRACRACAVTRSPHAPQCLCILLRLRQRLTLNGDRGGVPGLLGIGWG